MSNNKAATKEPSGYVDTIDRPIWIDDESEKIIQEADFAKIRTFFHDHTPSRNTSARAITFEDYGWHDIEKLQSELFKNFDEKHYSSAEKDNDMSASLERIGLDVAQWYEVDEDKICICTNKKKKIDKLFSHLRNSFAHNRYAIKKLPESNDYIFIFEDKDNLNHVSARMVLKKSTLEKWMSIIQNGEK